VLGEEEGLATLETSIKRLLSISPSEVGDLATKPPASEASGGIELL